MVKSASGDNKMELARKLLDENKPLEALERLKELFADYAGRMAADDVLTGQRRR